MEWVIANTRRTFFVFGMDSCGEPLFTTLIERAATYVTLEAANRVADKINDLGKWYVEAIRKDIAC